MNKILDLLPEIPDDIRASLKSKLHVIDQVAYAEEHYKHNPAVSRCHPDDRLKAKMYLVEVANVILTYSK